MTTERPGYSIIVPQETAHRAAKYLRALQSGQLQPGARLHHCLRGVGLAAMSAEDLLGCLFDTKLPQVFAESAVAGDGSDWNPVELGLLGDISVAVPVTVFDDGNHDAPTPHEPPFPGTLVFTAGALLRNGRGCIPADWAEVTTGDGQLSGPGYYGLYLRRLLPVFQYISARSRKRAAFVTVPGLGCGQFAGSFRGQLGGHLERVLQRLLTEHGVSLPGIKAVYFGPYEECDNSREEIHGISFMVRRLSAQGNSGKPQLCRPQSYAEPGDDFSDCEFHSLVAWDHVSWPGNDFFAGARATDDGVKAAATSSMSALTGVEGRYDPGRGKYLPPQPWSTWGEVVRDRMAKGGLRLWNGEALW